MNTEEQAKAKWCPFGNRDDGDNPVTFCIASECMAWRWGERLESEREAYMRGTDLRRTLQSTTDGYCGLVGTP
jgi:hypothetical protein